jgi:hypothetical protein
MAEVAAVGCQAAVVVGCPTLGEVAVGCQQVGESGNCLAVAAVVDCPVEAVAATYVQ